MIRYASLSWLCSSLLCAAALSQTPTDTSLVIYNSGIGLTHEKRTLTVKSGSQSIVYPGVATTVQTDSVSVQLPKGIRLYTQQYRYDKISLGKILESYVGKAVRFTRDSASGKLSKGILLATNPPVVKTDRGIESGIKADNFVFDSIPDSLIMKPSLVWNMEANHAIAGEMSLDYLISGIRWKSDYILTLGTTEGDLTGWITVDNHSGKRFEKTSLYLLAGDINRAAVARRYAEVMARSDKAADVTQKALEGYHLYSVPFPVTLADSEKTQIKFMQQRHHALKRIYDVTMLPPFSTAKTRKHPVSQSVELAPFSVPLPAGIVRSYATTGGTTILLGETSLANTPKGEKVTLRLGTNFDLVAKERLVSRSDDSRYLGATVAYTLTNRSDAAKAVRVAVPSVVKSDTRRSSVDTNLPYTRPDGNTLLFTIKLSPGETKTWKVTYRSRKP